MRFKLTVLFYLFLSIVSGCVAVAKESPTLLPLPPEPSDERQLVVISDLHMGSGSIRGGAVDCENPGERWKNTEDFRWCSEFRQFLKEIDAIGKKNDLPTDIVIAGDFLELWQSDKIECGRKGNRNLSCSEAQALERVERVVEAHRETLRAIGWFADQGDNRVIVVPGNHDAALVFDEVKDRVVAEVPTLVPGKFLIATEGYWQSADGRIFVEHGHQMKADPSRYRDLQPTSVLSR